MVAGMSGIEDGVTSSRGGESAIRDADADEGGGESDGFVFEDNDSEESLGWDGQWVAQEPGPSEPGAEEWGGEVGEGRPGTGRGESAGRWSGVGASGGGDGADDDGLDGSDVECFVLPAMATQTEGGAAERLGNSAQSRPGSLRRSRPSSSRPESAARSRPTSGQVPDALRPSSGRLEYRPAGEPARPPRKYGMARRRAEVAAQLESLWSKADEGGEAAVAALCEAAALCRVRIESDACRRAAREQVRAARPAAHRSEGEGAEGPEVTSAELLRVYLALSRAYLGLGPAYGAQALAAALRAKKLVGPDIPAEVSRRVVPEVLALCAAAHRARGNLQDCVGSLESLLHYTESVNGAASGAFRRKHALRTGKASLRIILALADANLEWGHRVAKTALKRQRLDELRLQMRRDKWAHLDVSYKRREEKLVAALGGAKDSGMQGADGAAPVGPDVVGDPDEIYGECWDCLDAAQERVEELAERAGAPALAPGMRLGIMCRRAELLAARCGARSVLSRESMNGPSVAEDSDPCDAFIDMSLDMKRAAVQGFIHASAPASAAAGGGPDAADPEAAAPEAGELQEALGALLRLSDLHLALRQPDDALSVLSIADSIAQRWGPGGGVSFLQRKVSLARAMVARKAGRRDEALASFQDVEALAEADLEGGGDAAGRRVGAKLWVAEALLEAGKHREGASKYAEASSEAAESGHSEAGTIAHRARAVHAALRTTLGGRVEEAPPAPPSPPFSPWRVEE